MLDSGANVFVVDEGSPYIKEVLNDTTLHTSAGEVPAKAAILDTPFGSMPGLISKGSPSLVPMHYVPDRGGNIRWDAKGMHLDVHEGEGRRELPVKIVDGIPRIYMPGEQALGTAVSADEPKQMGKQEWRLRRIMQWYVRRRNERLKEAADRQCREDQDRRNCPDEEGATTVREGGLRPPSESWGTPKMRDDEEVNDDRSVSDIVPRQLFYSAMEASAQLEDEVKSVSISLASRMGPPCSQGREIEHRAEHHRPFDNRCPGCIQAQLRNRPHRRQDSDRIGNMAIDVVSLGKTKEDTKLVVGVCHVKTDLEKDTEGHKRVIAVVPTERKDTNEIKLALFKLVLIMERIWNVVPLKRVHADRESAVTGAAIPNSLAERGIAVTVTQGGDPAANADAENAIGALCRAARATMAHIDCQMTKRRLWRFAMSHAATIISLEASPKGAKIEAKDVAPFACQVKWHDPPGAELDHLEDRGKDAIYLMPAFETGNASVIYPINVSLDYRLGDMRAVVARTTVRPVQDADGQGVFPKVTISPTVDDLRNAPPANMRCGECRAMRVVPADNAHKFRERGFKCNMLKKTTCETPLGHETCESRLGRPKGSFSEGNTGVTPYSQDHIKDARRLAKDTQTTKEEHLDALKRSLLVEQKAEEEIRLCSEWRGGFSVEEIHEHGEASQVHGLHTQASSSIAEARIAHAAMAGVSRGCSASKGKPGKFAFVTRNMTRMEKSTEAAKVALQKEMTRMTDHGTFGTPMERQAAARLTPNATMCWGVMLASIKYAERESQYWKHKGRFVGLGNQITSIQSDQTKRKQPTSDLFAPVGSLTGARLIVTHAAIHGYELESCDVESAYLQAAWPEDREQHYIKIPKECYELLPTRLQHEVETLNNPVFPLRRALYGLPLAGFAWIMLFTSVLEKQGWKPAEGEPALYTKGSTMILVYVDDVVASGTMQDLARLWRELRTVFKFDPAEKATRFLGMTFSTVTLNQCKGYSISMEEYAGLVVVTYVKLYMLGGGDTSGKARPTPEDVTKARQTLRKHNSPMTEHVGHAFEEEKGDPTKGEVQRAQKMIGALLWYMRCGRNDIGLAVSTLASRIQTWGKDCDRQLSVLIGYIERTKDETLCILVDSRDDLDDLEMQCYTDSDLHSPRSQSCVLCGIVSNRTESQTFCPITWLSKAQQMCNTAVGASELVAAHLGVQECLPLVDIIFSKERGFQRGRKLLLRVDNSTVERIRVNGFSKTLAYLSKAIMLRMCMLKDLATLGLIDLKHIEGKMNPANIGTKVLPDTQHRSERRMGGLRCIKDGVVIVHDVPFRKSKPGCGNAPGADKGGDEREAVPEGADE